MGRRNTVAKFVNSILMYTCYCGTFPLRFFLTKPNQHVSKQTEKSIMQKSQILVGYLRLIYIYPTYVLQVQILSYLYTYRILKLIVCEAPVI